MNSPKSEISTQTFSISGEYIDVFKELEIVGTLHETYDPEEGNDAWFEIESAEADNTFTLHSDKQIAKVLGIDEANLSQFMVERSQGKLATYA